mgnify:CR=1 FL=1
MNANLASFLYLVSGILFILALRGLSHPTTSRRGNLFGMVGMAIAVVTTAALIVSLAVEGTAGIGLGWVLLGLLVGGTVGTVMAKRVEMTKMPELVAFMHSMIGLAAVFIAIAAVVVTIWIDRGFGALSDERAVLAAATLIIVGIQIFFSSFLLSILGLRRTS